MATLTCFAGFVLVPLPVESNVTDAGLTLQAFHISFKCPYLKYKNGLANRLYNNND